MVEQFLNGKVPAAVIQENIPKIPEAVRHELTDFANKILQATGTTVKYFPLETQKSEA